MTADVPGGAKTISTERLTTSNLATFVSRKAGRTAMSHEAGSSVVTLGFFSNSQADREKAAPMIAEFITEEVAGMTPFDERSRTEARGSRIGETVLARLIERRDRQNWPDFNKDRREAERVAKASVEEDAFAAAAVTLAYRLRRMDVGEAALDVVMAVGLVIREEKEQSDGIIVSLPEQRPNPAQGAGNISA